MANGMYRRDQIINKHGQYIGYWSKQRGNTEFEKFQNFNGLPNNTQFIIPDKQGNNITCIVDNVKILDGHMLVCFNHLGETILNTENCYSNSIYDVEEMLKDYNLL
jgi:hypothetical protein